jgi:hypothetical protein
MMIMRVALPSVRGQGVSDHPPDRFHGLCPTLSHCVIGRELSRFLTPTPAAKPKVGAIGPKSFRSSEAGRRTPGGGVRGDWFVCR